MPVKFDFVYPPNEPLSQCIWAGEEMRAAGLCDPIISDCEFENTINQLAQSKNTAAIFYGAPTQLSWLWNTDEKCEKWLNLAKNKALIGVGTEPATMPGIHESYLPNSIAMAKAIKNLTIFERSDAAHYRALGCAPVLMNQYYVPTSFYTRRTPFKQRLKKFQFFGSRHGKARKALLDALCSARLVDVLLIEKTPEALRRGDAEKALAAYNTWTGTVNLKSSHDFPLYQHMPRVYEARSCGAYLLDLQLFTADDVDRAVDAIKNVDWTSAEEIAEREYQEVQQFTPAAFYTKVLAQFGF